MMTTAVRLRLLALLIVGADAIISPSAAAAAVRTSLLPRTAVPQIYPPPTLSPLTVDALEAALDGGNNEKAAVQREACDAVLREFGVCDDGRSSKAQRLASGSPPLANSADGDGGRGSARATVVLPSGAGKTVLALRVCEAMQSALTVVLVPGLPLIDQSYRDWASWRDTPGPLDGWRPLAVCSGSSLSASELPRTTDAGEIASFLAAGGGAAVLFCTYHSAARVGEALEATGARADLLICDEAHRCTGRLTKRDAQPLSDAFLPASRRLFLTATPKLIGAKRDKEGALAVAGSIGRQHDRSWIMNMIRT